MGAQMKIMTHLLNGKRVGQFVDLKQHNTDEVVQEALDGGFVQGKKELIVAIVEGVMKSMAAGVSRDGNGRKIDGYVSLQPSLKCKMDDICDPVEKSKCRAGLIAHVLSEGQVDTSGWSFMIEGAVGTISVTSITTGEAINEIVIGKVVDINGTDLAGATVAYALADGTKSGTIPAAKAECSATRISLTADALSELAGSEYVGKILVFTVTNGNKKAIKSVTIRAAA